MISSSRALEWLTALAPELGVPALLVGVAALACGGWLWRRRRHARGTGAPAMRRIEALARQERFSEAGDVAMTQGHVEEAVAFYMRAGDYHKACVCLISLSQLERAAELYLSHGRVAEAGHYFQAAGAFRRAGDCLGHLGSRREAAELYERAGEHALAARLLAELGDHATAARLFERAGLPREAADQWAADPQLEPSQVLHAAALYDVAGCTRRAAECLATGGAWLRAAERFETLEDYGLAAQAYERGGAHREAAVAYERADALPEARTNYERAGDGLRVAEISLALGQPFAAGQAFYELGSYERAIETLQGIPETSSRWREATLLLGRMFLEKSLLERARQKLEALGPDPPRTRDDLEPLSLLALTYERSGDALRALGLVEKIEAMDPEWPKVGEWLERLQENAWGGSSRASIGQDARYELRGQIGRGGMGVVHLAQDRELERAVAVKFLPYDLASQAEFLQMFRQEARAAAAMNHPNIVHVYDVTVLGGRPCIVMEYVQGQTLRQLVRSASAGERQPLAARRLAEIARDTCDALAYAHHQQVIHRDVKPGNIMISDRGNAKLMDFGISKLLERGVEGQTRPRGTPQYMPPEQIMGLDVDGRTDLYALGISMFEVLTGQRPFRGKDIVHQQLHEPLPDPRTLRPDLPAALVETIQRACQKNADGRYQSAREMADALSAFLAPRAS
jgi:tetratricopeptide (TPR) repeat protein